MIVKLAALGALGYAGYRYWQNSQATGTGARVAFAGSQGDALVRDAGPAAMRSDLNRPWTKTDEESDQSFPASDPPANY